MRISAHRNLINYYILVEDFWVVHAGSILFLKKKKNKSKCCNHLADPEDKHPLDCFGF